MTERKHVTIYTDGACHGNPGPGGYGVVLLYGERRREVSGGHGLTTNNRMELMGPIEALKTLKERCQVTLYSDSKYVVDSMAKGWPVAIIYAMTAPANNCPNCNNNIYRG